MYGYVELGNGIYRRSLPIIGVDREHQELVLDNSGTSLPSRVPVRAVRGLGKIGYRLPVDPKMHEERGRPYYVTLSTAAALATGPRSMVAAARLLRELQ